MRQLRIVIYAGLVVAWAVFALWQYRDYGQQRDLVEESLRQQSRSIMTALVGGLKSHRRLGRYFEDQLQGMLDELIESEDVISVTVCLADGAVVLSSRGAPTSSSSPLNAPQPARTADVPPPTPFELVETFELSPAPAGLDGGGGGGGGGGAGLGRGGGPSGGRGRGLGPRRRGDETTGEGPFAAGGEFTARLVLNRNRADMLTRRVAWSHVIVTLAAGLVALSVGLAWRATMNLAEANGRTRVYEAETRHLRELSQAAAGLAHETRNPLGLIRGWTQRLADTTMTDAERQEHSRTIMEECDRVTARINQFLAFARPREPDSVRIDVRSLLEELVIIMQPDLEAGTLAIESHIAPAVGWLQADLELLRQVIFNLLQNAVQFAPDRSVISVNVVERNGGRAAVQVVDQGPGVAEDAVESLFTPYFTTRRDGTGLGLAIVRHIATLHDWTISYRPRPGGGSIFEIGNIHAADQQHDSDR